MNENYNIQVRNSPPVPKKKSAVRSITVLREYSAIKSNKANDIGPNTSESLGLTIVFVHAEFFSIKLSSGIF
jgi:hypothetical protein